MKIKTLSNGNVRLSYFEVTDRYSPEVTEVIRDFFVSGDYVFEWDADGLDSQQVCRALDGMGSTLMCRDEKNLASIIRREYHAMVRLCNAGRDDEREDAWSMRRSTLLEGDIVTGRHPLVKALLAKRAA